MTEFIPRHVFAGLPPRETSDRARMGQVHEGESQISLHTHTGIWGREESGNIRLPLIGAVPNLHQTIILRRGGRKKANTVGVMTDPVF